VYDCFGAGQRIAQETFGGRDWRTAPDLARPMHAAFQVMRDLHELLYYVTEAERLPQARPLYADLRSAAVRLDDLGGLDADGLAKLDVNGLRSEINPMLLAASTLVRAAHPGRDLRGADLVGARLAKADLRGASLRGAYLVGADLRGADLRTADLIGADLRGADVCGADFTGAIFLTQAQVDAARGSADTRLPPHLRHPAHWDASPTAAPGPASPGSGPTVPRSRSDQG